ncbi:MAG: ABC transporter permease [Christensenellales bacterium]
MNKRVNAHPSRIFRRIWEARELYLLMILPIAWYALFRYGPLYGIQIAFRDYRVSLGFWGSKWVGLEHFERFFQSFYIERLITNTLSINILSLLIGFPVPILFALLLNEINHERYKKTLQNVTYIPHFLSTVVLVSILQLIFNPNTGVYNMVRMKLGMSSTNYFVSATAFKPLYILSGIWQNMGWDSILYIAALSGIDVALYEAATIDGASRLQKIRYVSIPGILGTITIMLLLRTGQIMNIGYEKILLMQNDLNRSSSDVISTYVYRSGMLEGNYSFSTAINLFNSVCNIVLLFMANFTAKRLGGTSLW